MHSEDHPTHILHHTPGIANALLHQKGQVPFTASLVITNLFIYTHSSSSVSSIIHPDFWAQHFKLPSNYLRASVLQTKPQHAMTTHYPTVIVYIGIRMTIKWFICMQYGWKCWYHFTCHSHLFAKLLIRAPKLSWSSEEESNTIKCALLLDLLT